MNPSGQPRRSGKAPVVRQYAVTDCGPCCLLSVLRHWGGNASVAEVRSLVGTDMHGSSLFQLARAAETLGFEARGATGPFEELAKVTLPTIAHVVKPGGLLHYVVVERVSPDKVWIMDPAVGRHSMSRSEFEEIWRARAVLLLEPPAEADPKRLMDRQPEAWWRWIARHLNGEQAFVTQSVFLGAIYTALGLLTSVFVQQLLDEFIPRSDSVTLWLAGALLLMVLLFRALAGYGRQRLLATLQRRVGTALNREFVGRLFDLPLPFFERTRKGDITARLQDSLQTQNGALQIIGGAVIDGMLLLGACAALLVIARPLTWVAVAAIPLYGLLMVWAARELHARQSLALLAFTDAEARYIDSLQGVREIIGTGASAQFAERNHGSWKTFLGALEQFTVRQASLSSGAEAVGSCLLVGSLVYGASLVMIGALRLGELVGGYTLITLVLAAIARLADLFVAYQVTRVSGTRMLDVLQVPAQASGGVTPFALEERIELEDVSFVWPRGIQQLADVRLALHRGRMVGLTGANGAGKTTLVKLLRREYEPSAGRLLVDGRDAREIDLMGLRRGVALLSNDVAVFAGTLYDNVSLHRPDVGPDQVLRTIGDLGLGRFMQRFPAGLGTPIGEDGRQLSAGERYIVGLLRAVAGQPSVLIVDEAFAMLDPHSFRAMLGAIQGFAVNNAVLLISHDSRLLAHADEVYELASGRIAKAPRGGRGTEPDTESSIVFPVT